MDLSERKLKILQAIVGDYIRSAEPVGSRTLSKKYDMGISAATIRNEMSDLEEMGLLTHPHTSAGRVPSDKAYRLYVNSLMQRYELPESEKKVIDDRISSGIAELDRTLQRASQILSELTNLTAFAMTPTQDSNRLKYINILPVDTRTVVLMIVAESGKITNTAVHLKTDYDAKQLELLSKVMTHNYKGKRLTSLLTLDIVKDLENDIAALGRVAEDIVPSFLKTLENMLNVESVCGRARQNLLYSGIFRFQQSKNVHGDGEQKERAGKCSAEQRERRDHYDRRRKYRREYERMQPDYRNILCGRNVCRKTRSSRSDAHEI